MDEWIGDSINTVVCVCVFKISFFFLIKSELVKGLGRMDG